MRYSALPGRDTIDGLHETDRALSNKISTSVFADYLESYICSRPDKEECTVVSLAKFDAWINISLVSISD